MLSEIIKSEMSKINSEIKVRVEEKDNGIVIVFIKESKFDYVSLIGQDCLGSFDVREFAPIPMDVELELVLIEEIVAKNSNYEMENIWIMIDNDFKVI
ncbi:MAG: hypothetical protein RSC93_00295 [Erysipelotrichaceae bacterium]